MRPDGLTRVGCVAPARVPAPILLRMSLPLGESVDPERILIVEDDDALRGTLAHTLGTICPDVRTAGTLADAFREASQAQPDLIILDLGLPDGDGTELVKRLRTVADVPVIVLSGRDGEEDKVALLDAGADDVLRKPFGLEELAARCRTLLRRSANGLQERVCVGPLEVHLLLRQVTLRDQPVELSPREFALLCALLMPPGVVRSRQELLRMAWPPFSGGPRSVDTQVLTLRRKLEQAGLGEGGGIETMRQQGYRFSLDTLPDPTDDHSPELMPLPQPQPHQMGRLN